MHIIPTWDGNCVAMGQQYMKLSYSNRIWHDVFYLIQQDVFSQNMAICILTESNHRHVELGHPISPVGIRQFPTQRVMLNKQQSYPSCLIDTELQTKRFQLTRSKVSDHSR